jgi:hypothetical protein
MERLGLSCGATCAFEDPDLSQIDQLAVTRPVTVAQEVCVRGFAPPNGFPTYSSEPEQPLMGVPIKEGSLWHLTAQDCFEPVVFHLYVNGFAFTAPDGVENSVSLSPFALVRNCRFQSGECAKLKSFKVSLLDHDPAWYFAVQSTHEREAEEERSEWVLGISHTILLITDSILPRFSIVCDPLVDRQSTRMRLVAGYLVHRDDGGSISVLFCELRAQTDHVASLALYENENCDCPIDEISISESSVCCDIVGINCSCFVVDTHHFASPTPSERKVWLRAISNIKVKIRNREPEPTMAAIIHYRDSIREHISQMEATADSKICCTALLELRSFNTRAKADHTAKDGAGLGTAKMANMAGAKKSVQVSL